MRRRKIETEAQRRKRHADELDMAMIQRYGSHRAEWRVDAMHERDRAARRQAEVAK